MLQKYVGIKFVFILDSSLFFIVCIMQCMLCVDHTQTFLFESKIKKAIPEPTLLGQLSALNSNGQLPALPANTTRAPC